MPEATFSRKTLYLGTLAAAKAQVYTPTSGKIGLVHNITIHNTNTANETVQLYFKLGATDLRLYNMVVVPGDTAVIDYEKEGLVVDAGAEIGMCTSNAAKVNVKIDGSEETPAS